jgi:hypothetical protein
VTSRLSASVLNTRSTLPRSHHVTFRIFDTPRGSGQASSSAREKFALGARAKACRLTKELTRDPALDGPMSSRNPLAAG